MSTTAVVICASVAMTAWVTALIGGVAFMGKRDTPPLAARMLLFGALIGVGSCTAAVGGAATVECAR